MGPAAIPAREMVAFPLAARVARRTGPGDAGPPQPPRNRHGAMADELILVETANGVRRITLNRPNVLNSFTAPMAASLRVAVESCATDDDVRAVLITGAGRGFCAGQDLSAVVPAAGEPAPDLGDLVKHCYNPMIRAIRRLEKPVVAAVNGIAAGAGANLALACDIVIASSAAAFVQSFSKVGLIPDSGGTFFLPRLVGVQRATALAFLGDKVSAQQALDWGLIWMVTEPSTLDDEATNLAERLARMPTRGLGLIKRGINASLGNGLDAQLDIEEALQREAGQTHDYAEGVRAFLDKRPPTFTGH